MSELNINEPWVSTKEIAEHLGVPMETERKWIKNSTIPAPAWVNCGNSKNQKSTLG